MTAHRLARMLGLANLFIGVANHSPMHVLIGLLVAASLYLDRA